MTYDHENEHVGIESTDLLRLGLSFVSHAMCLRFKVRAQHRTSRSYRMELDAPTLRKSLLLIGIVGGKLLRKRIVNNKYGFLLVLQIFSFDVMGRPSISSGNFLPGRSPHKGCHSVRGM